MWAIEMRGADSPSQRLVFVLNDDGVLQWSGPTIIGALRHLAEWGQEQATIDVDSAIWFFGQDETG